MRALWAAWAATRALLLALLAAPRVGGPSLFRDVERYEVWGRGIAEWSRLPYRDYGWEYPPGAALVVTPPAFAGDAYAAVFVALMVVADLLVLLGLVRLGARLGAARGAWLWVAGVTLAGPIVLTRFDTVSALLAVLAVLALAAGAPVAAGLALGGGAVTKLWPAVLLVAVPFVTGRRRLLLAAGAVVVVSVAAVLAVGGGAHGGELFARHSERGLQVESVPATPVVVAQRAGAHVGIDFFPSSGSWDVTGTGAGAALTASAVLTLLALAAVALLAWRARRAPEAWPDVVATALLLVTVAGKVLSPQYALWLLALLAAALCRRGSPLLVPAAIVAGAGVLTQFVYPAYYGDLVNGGGAVVVAVLALRNVLLVVATALAVRGVWRVTAR